MKRLRNIFLILTIGLLVSCSSDNNSDSNSNASQIQGTWELYSLVSNGIEFIDDSDCLDRIIFTANTVKSIEYYDYEDGNGCILDYESEAGPYTLTGNMLTGTVDGITVSFEIITLNATTLKMESTITEDGVAFTFVEILRRL